MKRSILLTVVLILGEFPNGLSTVAGDDALPVLRIVASNEGYEFFEGGSPVLFYQAKPKSLDGKFTRAGYVHPLYDLDGHVLSEDFPTDHLHHRGIFWAWHQLYVGDTQIGDPWICRDFLSRVDDVALIKGDRDSVALQSTVRWISPDWQDPEGQPKPIVQEQTVIQLRRSKADQRLIDFRIQLTALEPNVRIGGSDDAKGYGGFSPRLQLPQDIRFIAEHGEVEPQKLAVKASRWMDMVGSFGKKDETSASTISGVAILCHPSVPGFPQKWILRKTRSMQNPVFPGRKPVTLPTDKPLELRYRMILHRGQASPQQLAAWFDEYASEK